ncbi:3100_t:CDS:1 [Dentiscutata heterogama]|uniref:3100_t:CDS:1 n=1 Tax=Dentiscutata heterogama TaxID=1316150 RepID=A0ACA9KAP5_9GLOM|nr:3100_t:CDS:1 [Dentiscutata heterogama]
MNKIALILISTIVFINSVITITVALNYSRNNNIQFEPIDNSMSLAKRQSCNVTCATAQTCCGSRCCGITQTCCPGSRCCGTAETCCGNLCCGAAEKCCGNSTCCGSTQTCCINTNTCCNLGQSCGSTGCTG